MAPRLRLLIVAGLSVIMVIALAVLNWPASEPADGPTGSSKLPRSGDASATEPEEPPPERMTVLVIGTDSRPDDPGRTDTIIVATVDTGTGEVHLLSIPRDTWVYIPNHGWDKINHAYAVAPDDERPQTVMQVVSDMLSVKIENYVVVHMGGFQDVVDLLGGVDIYVEKDMYYYDPMDTPPLLIDLKEGQQRLDGENALKYVRYRSDDQGDWGRMQRQQKFLKALAKEALQVRNIRDARPLYQALVAAVDTNLTVRDVGRIALSAHKLKLDDLNSAIVGGFDRMIGGIYFMEPNLADARTLAHRQVYGKEPPPEVLEDAAADFAEARFVIESEIARFEELARLEEEAAAAAQEGEGGDEDGDRDGDADGAGAGGDGDGTGSTGDEDPDGDGPPGLTDPWPGGGRGGRGGRGQDGPWQDGREPDGRGRSGHSGEGSGDPGGSESNGFGG